MTDPSPDDRIPRLNAAVDGELDAAHWLELERDMRDDPTLAAQYRLIASTREAIQRFAAALTPRLGGTAFPCPRSAGVRSRASERAEAELRRMGI